MQYKTTSSLELIFNMLVNEKLLKAVKNNLDSFKRIIIHNTFSALKLIQYMSSNKAFLLVTIQNINCFVKIIEHDTIAAFTLVSYISQNTRMVKHIQDNLECFIDIIKHNNTQDIIEVVALFANKVTEVLRKDLHDLINNASNSSIATQTLARLISEEGELNALAQKDPGFFIDLIKKESIIAGVLVQCIYQDKNFLMLIKNYRQFFAAVMQHDTVTYSMLIYFILKNHEACIETIDRGQDLLIIITQYNTLAAIEMIEYMLKDRIYLTQVRDNLAFFKEIIQHSNLVACALIRYIFEEPESGMIFIKDNFAFFARLLKCDNEISGHFISNLLFSEERITQVQQNLDLFLKILQHNNIVTLFLLQLMIIDGMFLENVKQNEEIFINIIHHNTVASAELLQNIYEEDMTPCCNHLQSFMKIIKLNTSSAIRLIQGMFYNEESANDVDNHIDLFTKIVSHESIVVLSIVERVLDNSVSLHRVVNHQPLLEVILDIDSNITESAVKMSIYQFLQNRGELRGLEHHHEFLRFTSKFAPYLSHAELMQVFPQYQNIASSPQISSLYNRGLIK